MPVRVRAQDGSVQTFPDGTSPEVIRHAMKAYENSEDWGGLARKVASAAGQLTSPVMATASQSSNAPTDVRGPNWAQRIAEFNPGGKIAALPDTARGLVAGIASYGAGTLAGGNPGVRIGDNAIQFTNSPVNLDGRAFTQGNVQIYARGNGPERYTKSYTGNAVRNGAHEEGHTRQNELLGSLFIPAEILGAIFFGDRNPLEVGADRYGLGRSRTGF